MFIQTETTPNPATLKFLPGRVLVEGGPREFRSAEEAKASPLAKRLFEIDGVIGVFVGADLLTVSKTTGGLDWPQMKAPVLAAIMDHFTSGEPLFADEAAGEASAAAHEAYEGDAGQIVAEIKELLDTRVRPAVAQDGGDILFDRFEPETGVLWLQLRGACSGCPSSSATLKAGVENMLRHYVPEVTRVEQVRL
jgi:Fe-S cluster biogenesis protein NfuA